MHEFGLPGRFGHGLLLTSGGQSAGSPPPPGFGQPREQYIHERRGHHEPSAPIEEQLEVRAEYLLLNVQQQGRNAEHYGSLAQPPGWRERRRYYRPRHVPGPEPPLRHHRREGHPAPGG